MDIVEDYRNQLEKDNSSVKIPLLYDGNEIDNNNNNESHLLVEADRERISQVISNLLNNAVKFTKEGNISINVLKKIGRKGKGKEVDIQEEQEVVIVNIKDTGTGIDSEILPRLFTKFASKSDTGGTGLGLFISKSIVEAHGGEIWAKNNVSDERLEKGATFAFSLPI